MGRCFRITDVIRFATHVWTYLSGYLLEAVFEGGANENTCMRK